MTKHEKWLQDYRDNNATPEELQAILGPNWAICRKTPRNLERYSNCVTQKEYAAAQAKAIAARPKDLARLTRDLEDLVAKYCISDVVAQLTRLV